MSTNDDELQLNQLSEFEAKYWILDVKKLETDIIVVGYSNNSIETFSLQDFNLKSISFLKGTLNCLLYSMKIHGNTLDDILIASGTIFHDILIWNLNKKLVHQLKGHAGVIFCVEFSHDKSYLISGSDDRTIKLWSLKHCNKEPITCYGHTARIWDCKFLSENMIVSCSEDTFVKIWNFKGECLKTFQGHTGKNVWRVCVHPKCDMIASGGSDSSVKFWRLSESKMKNVDIKNIKGIDILNGKFYIVTLDGVIYLYGGMTTDIVFKFNNSMNFSVISVCPSNESYALLGDVYGNLYLIDFQLNKHRTIENFSKSRILKIFWQNHENGTFIFVATSDGTVHQFMHKKEDIIYIDSINIGKKSITSLLLKDSNLLIGDSKGFVKYYEFLNGKIGTKPLYSTKMHQNVNVSDIKYWQSNIYFSTGWDGGICCFFIEDQKFHYLYSYKMNSIFNCLEKMYFTENHDLIVYGYSGNYLIVYNFTQKLRVCFLILMKLF